MKRLMLAFLALLLATAPAWAQYVSVRPDATNGTNVAVTCGTTAGSALAANAKRRTWALSAPSTNSGTVFWGFTSSVTTANGLPLGPGIVWTDDTYIGAVFCIVGSGTQTLNVLEIAR